jgi:hypothetical protein
MPTRDASGNGRKVRPRKPCGDPGDLICQCRRRLFVLDEWAMRFDKEE